MHTVFCWVKVVQYLFLWYHRTPSRLFRSLFCSLWFWIFKWNFALSLWYVITKLTNQTTRACVDIEGKEYKKNCSVIIHNFLRISIIFPLWCKLIVLLSFILVIPESKSSFINEGVKRSNLPSPIPRDALRPEFHFWVDIFTRITGEIFFSLVWLIVHRTDTAATWWWWLCGRFHPRRHCRLLSTAPSYVFVFTTYGSTWVSLEFWECRRRRLE